MSGFGFYIRCASCGLLSRSYPYRYDTTVAPRALLLPAANREKCAFEKVEIPIEGSLADDAIAELARTHSTENLAIAVPYISSAVEAIVLQPPLTCPRCNSATLECPFGAPPRPQRAAASIDQVVAESRDLEDDSVVVFRLSAPDAVITCNRYSDDGRTVYAWKVQSSDATTIERVATTLLAELRTRGSTCSEAITVRGSTRFEEYPVS